MPDKWWQQPVRMLRVDYAPGWHVLKDLDLEAIARSHKEDWAINCEWVVGSFGWDGCGHLVSFQSENFDRWPGLADFDYLRAYTPLAHKHGIRVVAYLNMHWFHPEFAALHPDWEQIQADGRPRGEAAPLYGQGRTFCVNTAWRDWAFLMIQEAMKTGIDGVFLDGPVVYPDCCYCPSCRALFERQHGAPPPPEDWTNPLWRHFVAFREDSLARFLADAQAKVRDVNTQGVIFLNAGSWHPGSWRVARDIQKLEPYQNFTGAEAFFHYARSCDAYMYAMAAKYLRAGANPALVFVHYMNGMWHYLLMPPAETQLAIAQTVAGAANPWLALIHSALESQPEGNEPPREMFAFLEQNKQYYTDVRSLAEVAVLFSTRTAQNYLSTQDALYAGTESATERDLILDRERRRAADLSARKRRCEQLMHASYQGWFHALTRAHVLFDIILDKDLTDAALSRYKLLLLPDVACLDRDAAGSIRRFVEKGGALLSSFEAGLYDERGNPSDALWDLLGIANLEGMFPAEVSDNYLQAVEEHWGFTQGRLVERGPYALRVNPHPRARTPAFFLAPLPRPYVALEGLTRNPALLLSDYGAGKVIYFPEAIGAFVAELAVPSAEQRVAQAVATLLPSPLVTLNAPKTVSVDAYRVGAGDTIAIHLVNNAHDGRPATEFHPAHDVSVAVRFAREPSRVFSLREKPPLAVEWLGDSLRITLPQLILYEVIIIEGAHL